MQSDLQLSETFLGLSSAEELSATAFQTKHKAFEDITIQIKGKENGN